MSRFGLVVGFIVSIALCSQGQERMAQSHKLIRPLQPLLEVLRGANVSGSLVLSAHCGENRAIPFSSPVFPHFPDLQNPGSSEGSPLQTLREMFASDKAIQVTQDRDGTIRIIEDGVQANLLGVRISHIAFESMRLPSQNAAFYASTALLRAILQAPEVVAFMKVHHIEFPFNGGGGSFGIEAGSDSVPPVQVTLDNLTLANALDKLTQMFPGVWLYEECSQPGKNGSFVGIWFFDLQGPGPYVQE
jgi:hypothetical protein